MTTDVTQAPPAVAAPPSEDPKTPPPPGNAPPAPVSTPAPPAAQQGPAAQAAPTEQTPPPQQAPAADATPPATPPAPPSPPPAPPEPTLEEAMRKFNGMQRGEEHIISTAEWRLINGYQQQQAVYQKADEDYTQRVQELHGRTDELAGKLNNVILDTLRSLAGRQDLTLTDIQQSYVNTQVSAPISAWKNEITDMVLEPIEELRRQNLRVTMEQNGRQASLRELRQLSGNALDEAIYQEGVRWAWRNPEPGKVVTTEAAIKARIESALAEWQAAHPEQAGPSLKTAAAAPMDTQFTTQAQVRAAHASGQIDNAQMREWQRSGRLAALPRE